MLYQYISKNFTLVLMGAMLVVSGAYAKGAIAKTADQDMKSTIVDCRRIQNNAVRLACYDKVGDIILDNQNPVEETPMLEHKDNASDVMDVVQEPKQDVFSRPQKNIRKKAKSNSKKSLNSPKKIVVNITKTTKFGYNKTKFFLGNGQVWKQTDSRTIHIKRNALSTAHIVKASLGSYMLRINGTGTAIRVVRIK